MKNIISKTNKKELFWLLLAPVSFVSIFYLSPIIENSIGEPISVFQIGRLTFFILLILISLFSVSIFKVAKKIVDDKKKPCFLIIALVIIESLYVTSFIHPTGQGIFFLGVFIPSIIINTILTYIITLIIKGLKK